LSSEAKQALDMILAKGEPTAVVIFADYGDGPVSVACGGSRLDIAALAVTGNAKLNDMLEGAQ
jgi:uncharacterized protein YjfI (DUF2170 family)